MAQDISKYIVSKWSDDCQKVFELINEWDASLKGLLDDRRIRCALHLSDGDIDKLRHYIELSQIDYRDLFWQAEYACGEDRIYDFSKTFVDNNLQ